MKRVLPLLLCVVLLFGITPVIHSYANTDSTSILMNDSSSEAENYGNIVSTDYCGDDIIWTLYDSGYLIIDGTGAMWGYPNYTESSRTRLAITDVIIKDGVSSIGAGAFKYCYNIKTIVMADSVTYIGPEAIHCCSSLTSIRLSENLVTIDNDFAFWKCTSLARIVIPASVRYIGNYAFRNCSNLKEIYFKGSAVSFGFNVLRYETLTAYYPEYDTTWTETARKRIGGNVTWVSYYPNDIEEDTCFQGALSSEDAILFIGFLTDNINPKTHKKWKKGEIEQTNWYKICTNTYSGNDYRAQVSAFVDYVYLATGIMSNQSSVNISYLTEQIIAYLEKETGKANLDEEILNEYKNAALKKLTEAFNDIINQLLPVSADSIFSVTDVYEYYSSAVGTPAKAEKLAERIAAAIESGILVKQFENRGRYSYFNFYLTHRDGYSSAKDTLFQAQLDCQRTVYRNDNYLAGIYDIFTWITRKESFLKNFDTMDSWAEFVFQLGCYTSNTVTGIEHHPEIEENLLEFTVSGDNASITAVDSSVNGYVVIPNTIGPNAVTSISSNALENCTQIEEIKFGSDLTAIGAYALKNCMSLKNVIIPDSVTCIEDGSFENCTSLENVFMSNNVEFIGSNVFSGCSEQSKIVCNCTNSYILNYWASLKTRTNYKDMI